MDTQRALRVRSSARRGSSWPVVVDTDAGPFFTKLAGAGHGASALVAEVVVAALAEAIGLRVPRRAIIHIDDQLASENRDPELLALLRASHGLNLGFEVISGARDLRAEDVPGISADDAARVLWLDWLVLNPDRTAQNPNLLVRRDELWLIDHGSALGFHHDWSRVTEDSPARVWHPSTPHVLASRAADLADWDALLTETIDRDTIKAAVREVPDEFLQPLVDEGSTRTTLARRRAAYTAFLWKRLRSPRRVG